MFRGNNTLIVKKNGKGLGVYANRSYEKEEIVSKLEYDSIKNRLESSDESIQIDEDKFLDSKYRYVDDFINHSCDPNARIDFSLMNYVALRNIKEGEEITWNYLTTEYDLEDEIKFNCKCGSKKCLGRIKGFKFLTRGQKQSLDLLLSPFLRKKFRQELLRS